MRRQGAPRRHHHRRLQVRAVLAVLAVLRGGGGGGCASWPRRLVMRCRMRSMPRLPVLRV